MTRSFLRFVALGDSTTEGLYDGDGAGGYRGWADRLAERLAATDPQVRYANLAVRGRYTRQVHDEQLPAALALRPDLATVLSGVNDLLRPRFDADEVAGHLAAMYSALTGAGAHVVAFTLPDPARLVPVARGLARRAYAVNDRIRVVADRPGVSLVDVAPHPVCTDARLWNPDRLHLNPLGHSRLAAAAAHALGLPGSDAGWSDPLERRASPSVAGRVAIELHWATTIVAPWILRRLRGRSAGDGRSAKRPDLAPVRPTD